MSDEFYYYVMQTFKGQVFAHGPYRTEKAAVHRRDNVQGGEAVVFRTFNSDPVAATQEFKTQEL